MRIFVRSVLLLMFIFPNLWASQWYSQDDNNNTVLNVTLFLTSTCPHCQNEDAFFKQLETKIPWIKVQRYYINQDKKALVLFDQFIADPSNPDFSVPSAFFCNSRWIGFETVQTTGKELLGALIYCKKQIDTKKQLTENAVSYLKTQANANTFQSGIQDTSWASVYTLALSLIDAMGPCAYFCFLAFWAILFVHDTKQQRMLAGFLFIATIGFVHYFEQVQSSVFFELLPYLRIPAAIVGIILLIGLVRIFQRKQNPYPLFLALTVPLALLIQAYQETCQMNWSNTFQQWLHNAGFSALQQTLYQLAFQLLYLVILVILLLLYVRMMQKERFNRNQPLLELAGKMLLFILAVILIIYPLLLANLSLSCITGLTVFVITWVIAMRLRNG